jgi:hypothetical protein
MRTERLPRVLLVALAIMGVAACAVGGPGYYDGGVDVGYVGGFYEPCCYDYGGWGGRYRVGPPPGGHWRPEGHPGESRPGAGHVGGGHPGGGRPAPSIPNRPRAH